jgi:NAD+ kinase
MNLLIVSKQNQLCFEASKKLEAVMKKEGHGIKFDSTTAKKMRKPGEKIEKFHGDMVITLGGDGTFIYASEKTKLPILPVRVEGFGYLSTIDFDELLKHPFLLKDGKVIERARLKITGSGIKAPLAVNEIIFVRKIPSKIISICLEIDGAEFKWRGDGVIISTPSGSTAYGLSAGGSVIDPKLNAVEIVPILPFNSCMKPMTIPDSKKIKLNADSGFILIDGTWEKLVHDKKFVIESGEPVRVISFGENFYRKFHEKFME